MNLKHFDKKNTAKQALKEHFEVKFDPSKLNRMQTQHYLTKVRKLISEAKKDPASYYNNLKKDSYLRLMFMEQALVEHAKTLKKPRIVLENTEVDKSQAILAAQDMVDSIQKMLEDTSEMLVKELPALVDAIQSDIGVNESTQFNQAAQQALNALSQSLTQARDGMQQALGGITGQEGGPGFDAGAGDMGAEMPAGDMGAEMPAGDMGAEAPPPEAAPEEPAPAAPEAPEAPATGGAGRAKR